MHSVAHSTRASAAVATTTNGNTAHWAPYQWGADVAGMMRWNDLCLKKPNNWCLMRPDD